MSGSGEATPRIVAVAGGRGGSGKSLLAANIGIFLATLGKRVVLVDAALGSANAHVFCGVARPVHSLAEAIRDDALPLSALLEATPAPGLQLVAGASDPAWISNPTDEQVRRLMAGLRDLDADFVIADLSSGTSRHVIDMFLRADIGVMVAVPEPTSVELTYRFMRTAFVRLLEARGLAEAAELTYGDRPRIDGGVPSPIDLYDAARERDEELAQHIEDTILQFHPRLVVNGARSKADMELGKAVTSAARRRLGITVQYLGHLEYDEAVWVAVRRRRPLLVEHPESRVSRCIEKVTRGLLASTTRPTPDNVVTGDTYYELLDVAPTASFEDIRRANRRMRDVYGTESVVMSGLYSEEGLAEIHRRMDVAYNTLMDATRRKEYDHELFPDGVPYAQLTGPDVLTKRADEPPVERPPMPTLTPQTDYTGALLAQIREARGVDLREIAERTKIGMAYLTALEGEDFEKLPAVVYVRGFLVEYSKILDLDHKDLLKTYLERYKVARVEIDKREDGW